MHTATFLCECLCACERLASLLLALFIPIVFSLIIIHRVISLIYWCAQTDTIFCHLYLLCLCFLGLILVCHAEKALCPKEILWPLAQNTMVWLGLCVLLLWALVRVDSISQNGWSFMLVHVHTGWFGLYFSASLMIFTAKSRGDIHIRNNNTSLYTLRQNEISQCKLNALINREEQMLMNTLLVCFRGHSHRP